MTLLMRAAPVPLLILSLAYGAAAQTVSTTAGAINGTVTDSTKAVLPGATVTLSGSAVMGAPAAVTDANGLYRFAGLAPGDYTLTFDLAGFGTLKRDGIRVSLGFTATVNVELNPATLAETVTVSGASPVVDLQSTNVTTHFDSDRLANLPGSRDVWAVLAQTPAVSMGRVDVGGSGALTQQPYTAYGLASAGGVNRGEIEGIMVNEGGGGGGSDMGIYTDYGSFTEIAINAVGNTAEMPSPGVLSQLIAKSGGNQYHGNVYFDYQNDSMEAVNIDSGQIAAGVSGSNVLAARDTNRLSELQDFNADVGGYLKKDRLWWFGAYRRTVTDQRYPTLIDDVQHTWVPVATAKVTYNITQTQKLIGYYQHATKEQPDYLGAIRIGGGRQTSAIMTADSVWHSGFPGHVWKTEYSTVLTNSLLLEVRSGAYHSVWWRKGKSSAPRVEDIGNNVVSGGVWSTDLRRHRPQVSGALSYSRSGWAGTHNFKFGGEVMRDLLVQPFTGFSNAGNSVSVLNNGVPNQVDLYLAPSESKNGLWTNSAYVSDTWQFAKRLTLNLGLRFDRHSAYLPDQTGPGSQRFARVDNIVGFNNWGPRLGASFDLTGSGKTLIKANYGNYWLYPSSGLPTDLNPNATMWLRRYSWSDRNGNGVWDPGEEGNLLSVTGGTTATTFDPDLENTYVRQATVYLEREVAANFGVRTGFVWNGRRQVRGTINVNRPLSAYSVPIAIRDPGPDGRTGTADDGGMFTAFNLAPEFQGRPIVNIARNLDGTDSDYYTWEITGTKRMTGRWALLGSFAHTWRREAALGGGAGYTPNAFINTEDERAKSTTWQGKINATLNLNWDLRVTPILRHQSGSPFGRTFVQTLNHGNATIRAEPVNARRMPNITVFDVRTEKAFRVKRVARVTGFLDVYNIFNTNAEQEIATGSGASYLRPVAITAPRIARVGIKLDW
jgi:hypothetical protein